MLLKNFIKWTTSTVIRKRECMNKKHKKKMPGFSRLVYKENLKRYFAEQSCSGKVERNTNKGK